jgi:hypothetical protein
MPFKNGRQHMHSIKNLRPALILLDLGISVGTRLLMAIDVDFGRSSMVESP